MARLYGLGVSGLDDREGIKDGAKGCGTNPHQDELALATTARSPPAARTQEAAEEAKDCATRS